jgi:hypothetical protein
MKVSFVATAVFFALAASAGCSKPKVPEQDIPPTLKSADTAPATMTEAIHQPIDQAKAVRETTEDAATEQRKAIDAATDE